MNRTIRSVLAAALLSALVASAALAHEGNPSRAWILHLHAGLVNNHVMDIGNFVWPVRGGR